MPIRICMTDRDDEQQHDDRRRRRAQDLRHRRLIAAQQRNQDDHRRDGKRNIGDRGEPLPPEMLGAGMRGAVAADAARAACAYARGRSSRPSHGSSTKTHSTSVSAIEPMRFAADEPFAFVRPEAAAGIPDEMADAAEHVVHQRPGIAEQDRAGRSRSRRTTGIAHRRWDSRPRSATRPAAACRNRARAGNAMHDRHHHRQRRPVDLQMRRKRPLGGASSFNRAGSAIMSSESASFTRARRMRTQAGAVPTDPLAARNAPLCIAKPSGVSNFVFHEK